MDHHAIDAGGRGGRTGWEALVAWGSGRILDRLPGCRGFDLRLVTIDGQRAIARLGSHGLDEVAWELDLLEMLAAFGVGVPEILPTRDGRTHVDELVLVKEVVGLPPQTEADWCEIAELLDRLHDVTANWRQRPGAVSSIDLSAGRACGRVDLTLLPADVLARCTGAWRRMDASRAAVVHAELRPGSVVMAASGPVLMDWSTARVDVPDLDLTHLPGDLPGLDGALRRDAVRASAAWEVATLWHSEPELARRRLAQLEGL